VLLISTLAIRFLSRLYLDIVACRDGDRGRLAGAGAPASNFFPAPLLIILIYLA
jgi:hypothetical protein